MFVLIFISNIIFMTFLKMKKKCKSLERLF